MKDYKQSFVYLAMNDQYTANNWRQDVRVMSYLDKLEIAIKKLEGVDIARAWKKAYAYAKGEQNILLYRGIRELNMSYVIKGRYHEKKKKACA